jgi:hypothetical protein
MFGDYGSEDFMLKSRCSNLPLMHVNSII